MSTGNTRWGIRVGTVLADQRLEPRQEEHIGGHVARVEGLALLERLAQPPSIKRARTPDWLVRLLAACSMACSRLGVRWPRIARAHIVECRLAHGPVLRRVALARAGAARLRHPGLFAGVRLCAGELRSFGVRCSQAHTRDPSRLSLPHGPPHGPGDTTALVAENRQTSTMQPVPSRPRAAGASQLSRPTARILFMMWTAPGAATPRSRCWLRRSSPSMTRYLAVFSTHISVGR